MKAGKTRNETRQGAIAIAILAAAFMLAVVSRPIRFVDDAWISFRYADNLAFRGELTFNRGERVEGVSNLLWTLMLAGERPILPIDIERLAGASALVLTALWLHRLWKIGRALGVDGILSSLAVATVILTPSVRETMLNGLEGPLFALLLAEASLRLLRGQMTAAALCFGLLFLTRVESAALGGAAMILLLQPSVRIQDGLSVSIRLFDFRSPERRAVVGRALAIFLGIVAAGSAFRLLYYRELLPNSVQAKLYPYSGTLVKAGWFYAVEFLREDPHLALVAVLALTVLLMGRARTHPEEQLRVSPAAETWDLVLRVGLLAILFSFVVVIRSGGDWMGGFRLLSMYAGMYVLLLLMVLSVILSRNETPLPRAAPLEQPEPVMNRALGARRVAIVAVSVLLALPLWRTAQQAGARLLQAEPVFQLLRTPGFRFWDDIALRLTEAPLGNSDVVSSEGIGYLSYVLKDVYIHDPLGLTEKHIASEGKERSPFGKSDLRYTVFDVRPTVMIWHYAGNLRGLPADELDEAYVTFCHGDCRSWSADVVMIRRDRADILTSYFEDWTPLTFEELRAANS